METRVSPSAGAVQVHQTELVPPVLGTVGSPDSSVAPTLDPNALTDTPVMDVALVKLSFGGGAA